MSPSEEETLIEAMLLPIATFFGENDHPRDTARAVLSALRSSGYIILKGWQPIETAPKDGTVILLFEDDCRFVGHYLSAASRPGWYSSGNDPECDYPCPDRPTLWMPLPLPPVKEEEKAP